MYVMDDFRSKNEVSSTIVLSTTTHSNSSYLTVFYANFGPAEARQGHLQWISRAGVKICRIGRGDRPTRSTWGWWSKYSLTL